MAELRRKAGISQGDEFQLEKQYDGLLLDETRWLKQLENENGKLKKLVRWTSAPRQAHRQCFIEAFKLRRRVLNAHWFMSLEDVWE